MNLKIKPFSHKVRHYYENHGHFHEGDAGIDIFVIKTQTIAGFSTTMVHFQIACENKEMKPYFLIPRSSISKTPLRQSNSIGLIDAGYRGEIMASVDNIKSDPFKIEEGQRLFQLVAMDGSPISYELTDILSDTKRGIGGFGSTGE